MKYRKISNTKIITAIIIIFICNFFIENWSSYIVSAILMTLIYLITKLIMKNKFGWGDVLFALFTGLSLTPLTAVLSIIISVFVASLFFAVKFFRKKMEQKQLAFIPCMTISLFFCYIFFM